MKAATACLCLGLLLSASVVAGKPAAGTQFQIETTTASLLGEEEAGRMKKILPPDRTISWEVYYPRSDSVEPPGVLVYISPVKSGEMFPAWREVLDQHNMIYIGANQSGNPVPTNRRMVLATLAVRVLGRQFDIDPEKLFVSGFSGGGRVASYVASQYPGAFSGAIYICGVNFWKDSQTPEVDRVIRNRFVFLTGTADFNMNETRRIHQRYLDAGAQHSKLMVVSGMRHELPDADSLTEALQFLLGEGQPALVDPSGPDVIPRSQVEQ